MPSRRVANSIGFGVCLFAAISAIGKTYAQLGKQYDSYRDMHKDTQYGTLFFNKGAIRLRQSRQLKRFVQVTGNGALDLPSQEGYCFVFNHYDSPSGNDVKRKYFATIIKHFSDGHQTEEKFKGDFIPTSSVISPELPDLCILGINNAIGISVKFTSDDGIYFDWDISFRLGSEPN